MMELLIILMAVIVIVYAVRQGDETGEKIIKWILIAFAVLVALGIFVSGGWIDEIFG